MAMPRRRGLQPCPIDYLAPGQEWPDGDLLADAPDVAKFVQKLVQRLNKECSSDQTPSVYAVAKKANINSQTVFNLLSGKTWGDLPILYKLEAAIAHNLWTHDHLPEGWHLRRLGEPHRSRNAVD